MYAESITFFKLYSIILGKLFDACRPWKYIERNLTQRQRRCETMNKPKITANVAAS